MRADEHVEVLVVGAGAAGLLAASALAGAGLECRVVERRPFIRWGDRWCVEVDTRTILSQVIPTPGPEAVLHRGEGGADLVSPSGRHVRNVTPYPVWSIKLWEYEKQLLRGLEKAGVPVAFDCALTDFSPSGPRGVTCTLAEGKRRSRLGCDLLVMATGLNFELDRQLYAHAGILRKLPDTDFMSARQELWSVTAAQAERAPLPAPAGTVAFFMGAAGPLSIAAAWVDKGMSTGSILAGSMPDSGLASPAEILAQLREKHPVFTKRLSGGGSSIPVRRPADTLAGRGIALIGNAASQVYPLTGSGVALAGHASRLLAEAAREYCRQGHDSKALWQYNCRYMRGFGAIQAAADVFARWTRRSGPGVGQVEEMFAAGLVDVADFVRSIHLEFPVPGPMEMLSRAGVLLREPRRVAGLVPLAARVRAAYELFRRYPQAPDMQAVMQFSARAKRVVQA